MAEPLSPFVPYLDVTAPQYLFYSICKLVMRLVFEVLGTRTNFAYGQTNQTIFNNANPLNIKNIPIKKVHVEDIDIAYKIFGKGRPFLLISGVGGNMDAWEPSTSNHTLIVFDNRGVGNTTTGTKPFSIQQLANDTAGLLDALNEESLLG